MKFKIGDKVILVRYNDSGERGTLKDKIPLRSKGIVACVFSNAVEVDGLVWYNDEIKLVETVNEQ